MKIRTKVALGIITAAIITGFIGCITPVPPINIATPTITPNGGIFTDSVSVTMACATPLVNIYYTTNGTETSLDSPKYKSSIQLTDSATVKAQAIISTFTSSAVASASFIIYHSTAPTNPPVPPTPTNVLFRGCLFTPGSLHPSLPNNNGVRSQMDYRDCHGQANENIVRDAEYNDVATLGGNILIYIQGKSNYDNAVLDMCLNSRPSPVDGHRFPIANPLTTKSEVDTAAYYAKTLGVTKQLVWIWNDDKAVGFTRQTVKDAVTRYDKTLVDVWFGTCLETSEIASPADTAARLRDMREFAPTRPIVVGSCPVDFLLQVKSAGAPADTYYWLEQDASGNPLTDPLTMENAQSKILNKATALVNAGVQPSHIILGEWWATTASLRKQLTALFESKGYLVGSGQWK